MQEVITAETEYDLKDSLQPYLEDDWKVVPGTFYVTSYPYVPDWEYQKTHNGIAYKTVYFVVVEKNDFINVCSN